MNNLKRFASKTTGVIHLKDGHDELMYALGSDGEPDKSRPIKAHVYGPGSKQYARAKAAQQNRMIQRMNRKGSKMDQSAEQQAEESATFLTEITFQVDNLVDVDPEFSNSNEASGETVTTDRETIFEMYMDREIGFVVDQVAQYAGDWANF